MRAQAEFLAANGRKCHKVTKAKTAEIDLTKGPLLSKLIAFSVPVILSGLLQCLYNAADIVIVGRFAGDAPLAAVGATSTIVNLIVNLFMGLSVGTSITTAVSIGSGNSARTHRLVHASMALAIVCGLSATFIGIIGARSFLELLDTPSDIIGMSTLYLRIFFSGSVFSMVYNFGAAILRAAGDSKRPLYFLAISGLANIALNIVFVIVFKMDVDGVAYATVISQIISAWLVVVTLCKNSGSIKLYLRKIRFYSREVIDVVKTGLPAGIHSVVFSFSNSIIQASVNSFQTAAISGNTAAMNIESFIYTAIYSFHSTAVTASGQNLGAKRFDRINKLLPACLGLSVATGLIFGGLATLLAKPLISIYLPDSPESVEFGVTRLTILALTYFLCGAMDTITGLSRGLGNTFTPMLVSIVGVCGIRLGWVFFVFPKYHTPESLYLSYPISWFATAILQLILYLVYKRKLEKMYAK